MKCAFVASFFGPYYSNFVASLLAFHGEMISRGHQVFYVFPDACKNFQWIHKLQNTQAKIYFLPFSQFSLSIILKMRKIFKQEKVDIIYSRMNDWDLTARLAVPFTPVVWHIDMMVNLATRKKYIKNWLKYKLLAFFDTFPIGVSIPIAQTVNSLAPHHRCLALPNAIDLSRLKLRNGPGNRENGAYRLLIFAYNPINKGLDITLDALERINADMPRCQLLVSSQEKTYEYIEQRYKETPSWIRLVPPTDNIAELYDQCDAMLIPSLSEGFSYCLAEAIYTGLPVVYSDIPGNLWAGEFVQTYRCAKGNGDDLERAIRELISAPPITAEEQRHNREVMDAKYSLDLWKQKIADILEGILSRRQMDEEK